MIEYKLPKNMIGWVSYHPIPGEGAKYVMASNKTRDRFTLFEISKDGALTRMGSASSPIDLERKFKSIIHGNKKQEKEKI